jgi:hypothetical protein
MVYDWVLERLAQEKFGKTELSGKGLQLLNEIHGKLHNFLDSSKGQSRGSMRVAESSSEYSTGSAANKK